MSPENEQDLNSKFDMSSYILYSKDDNLHIFASDSFLRNRSSLDHEATAMMKAQFMSLWDGLDTAATSQVNTLTQNYSH